MREAAKPALLRPFHGVAVDQGSGLAAAIAAARGAAAGAGDLMTFKRAVVRHLGPDASALLVDAALGPALLGDVPAGCERILAYEADVYLIAAGERITRFPEGLRPADYARLGVRRLKFFLWYAPRGPEALNRRKRDLVAGLGRECARHGLEFLFEPLVYDEAHPDPASRAFALIRPDLVRAATEVFADPAFGVDVLKVEVPVTVAQVAGFGGDLPRDWALAAIARAAEPAGAVPLVYLSGGVSFAGFEAALHLAREAGVRAAGFMCGRALWSDAVAAFGRGGAGALERWLETEGRARLARLKAAAGAGT
jgi:tagatose 1,6-diphosphate aldolase